MVQKILPEQLKTAGTRPYTEIIRRIAIIVIVLVVISAISLMLSGGLTPSGTVSGTVSGTPSGAASGPGVRPASGSAPGHATETVAATAAPKKAVDFVLDSGDPASCGLTCRELTAAITNTGYEDAHNVCISLTMHNSRGEAIALDGDETFVRCIGDLGAGETRSEPVMINADCGMFALKCAKETLTLQTAVSSDETTVRFPDTELAV